VDLGDDLAALFVAANIPGNLLGGVLLRLRLPRWLVMAFGAAAMGVAALGAFRLGSDVARVGCLVAFSLLGGVVPAAVFSGATVHARSLQHVGTTNGMVMQASHLSQFVLPIVVAWVATRSGGWGASLGVMLLLSLIGVAAAFAVARYERR
jgi:hypothetical protein